MKVKIENKFFSLDASFKWTAGIWTRERARGREGDREGERDSLGFSQLEEGKYAMPDREVAVGAGRIIFSAYSDAAW